MNYYIYNNPSLPSDIAKDALLDKAGFFIGSINSNPAFYDCLLDDENIGWVENICGDLCRVEHLPYTDIQWMYQQKKFDHILVEKICTPAWCLKKI